MSRFHEPVRSLRLTSAISLCGHWLKKIIVVNASEHRVRIHSLTGADRIRRSSGDRVRHFAKPYATLGSITIDDECLRDISIEPFLLPSLSHPNRYHLLRRFPELPVDEIGGEAPHQRELVLCPGSDLEGARPECRKGFLHWKSTHDARLVAAVKVNGVGKILTFNVQDFVPFKGLEVLDPGQC